MPTPEFVGTRTPGSPIQVPKAEPTHEAALPQEADRGCLPLRAINEAPAREESIRNGHPGTLHLWWARRPLAACRAGLFASLVEDPESAPADLKADGTVDEARAGLKRAQLFNLIEELIQWENSHNLRVIYAARAAIARCVVSRKIELVEMKKDAVVSARRLITGGCGTPALIGSRHFHPTGMLSDPLVVMTWLPDPLTGNYPND